MMTRIIMEIGRILPFISNRNLPPFWNRGSKQNDRIVRRMIGFYNHLRNSESPIIIDSLKLSVELNEEGKTSWFTSVKKYSG